MREQLSHGQALRLVRGWTPFRTALLCSRASTRECSNWVTAAWHRVFQAEWSCVSLLRADGSMLHCFILTFRASLYRKTGPHYRRFPIASCPRNTCFGIRLSVGCPTVCRLSVCRKVNSTSNRTTNYCQTSIFSTKFDKLVIIITTDCI